MLNLGKALSKIEQKQVNGSVLTGCRALFKGCTVHEYCDGDICRPLRWI